MTPDKTTLSLVPLPQAHSLGAFGPLPTLAADSADYWRCRAAGAEQALAEAQQRQTQLADGLSLALGVMEHMGESGTAPAWFPETWQRVWACFSGETPQGENVPLLQSGPMLRSIGSLVASAMETGGASCLTFHPQRIVAHEQEDPEVVVVAAVGLECELLTFHLMLTERSRQILVRTEDL